MPDSNYISGFCNVGHHEGMRCPGPSGKLNKNCTMIDKCQCPHPQSHQFYSRMFADSGMDRVLVDNSGYAPERFSGWLPVPTVVEAPPILSTAPVDIAPDALESVSPGFAPPVARTTYGET